MSQEGRKILSDKIAKFRKMKGLNREQLSLLIDKDNSYISKLEKYKINISVDLLEAICVALDRNITDFIKR